MYLIYLNNSGHILRQLSDKSDTSVSIFIFTQRWILQQIEIFIYIVIKRLADGT